MKPSSGKQKHAYFGLDLPKSAYNDIKITLTLVYSEKI